MWIIGFIIGAVVLYYIISMAVEDGVLSALEKYDKLKNIKNIEE